MKRIRLIVAYDGTNYQGWQKQKDSSLRTIEGELNKAISDLLKKEVEVIGASRTDAGVHAYSNVAVFDSDSNIPPDKYAYALNTRLPYDIRVQYSDVVSKNWHPRKVECKKTYIYRILNRNIDIPTERLYSELCYFELDIEKMREACNYFIGTKDFTSFCSIKTSTLSNVRTIYDLQVIENADMIEIIISGNGFLYNMVRIIAGTLLEVGMSKIKPSEIIDILKAKDRTKAGKTLPAKGLFLADIDYDV